MPKFAGNGIVARIQHAEGSIAVAVPSLSLTATNPAVVTVGPTEVGKFHVGDTITIAGAPAGAASANSSSLVITAVNNTTGAITIGALNGSAWTGGPFTAPGITVKPVSNVIAVVPTAFTLAKPSVMTVPAAQADLFDPGSIVTIANTGAPQLDGKSFKIGTVTGTTVQLLGSDMTQQSISPTTGLATPIDPADMLQFCLSGFERKVASASSIDVSTFCGSESLPGLAAPGSITLDGFINYDEAAYAEFLRGVADGISRVMTIEPPIGGVIIYNITPTGVTETFGVNAGSSFKGDASLAHPPTYVIGQFA
jgi:hypothetical protein